LKQFKLKNGEPIPTLEDFMKLLEQTNMRGFVYYGHDNGKRNTETYFKKLFTELGDSSADYFVLGDNEPANNNQMGMIDWADANEPAIPTIWTPNPNPGKQTQNADEDRGNPTDGHWESYTVSSGPDGVEKIIPWPRQNDLPDGADVGFPTTKVFVDYTDAEIANAAAAGDTLVKRAKWIDEMLAVKASTYVFPENIDYDDSGNETVKRDADNKAAWDQAAGTGIRWVGSRNVPGYMDWANSGGDAECNPQQKFKQWLRCFQLKDDKSFFKRNSKTTILKRGCRTTALHHVKVKIKNSKKGLSKLIRNKGKRVIQTFNKGGKITITLTANGGKGYQDFKVVHERFVR
jgi:hypothetical protein